MSSFEIYIHGTPRGHQICGSEENHDYINKFYNHDNQAHEKAVMYAEVCNGDAYYTYIRRQNLYDTEGRPEAFFALTVSFNKSYCSNVYKLYNLLEQVYTKLCVGTIISQSGNKETYLVADLTLARSASGPTVKIIQSAINQNIKDSISQFVQPLTCGDTFDCPSMEISLLEVDSPLFVDNFKKFSLIISPTIQTASRARDTAKKELSEVSSQKDALSSTKIKLEAKVANLIKKNQTLSEELNRSVSASEKRYKNQLEQLRQDLSDVTKERDSLKEKITQASSTFEQMDKPLQQLTRLLAGRFPDKRTEIVDITKKETKKYPQKRKPTIWKEWVNSILLLLVLIISTAILVTVLLKNPKIDNTIKTTGTENPIPETKVAPSETKTVNVIESEVLDNDLSERFINPDEYDHDSWEVS